MCVCVCVCVCDTARELVLQVLVLSGLAGSGKANGNNLLAFLRGEGH